MFTKVFKPLTLSFVLTVVCVCAATFLSDAVEYGEWQEGKYCTSVTLDPATECPDYTSEAECKDIKYVRNGGVCEDGNSNQKCRVKYNVKGKNSTRKCSWVNGNECKQTGSSRDDETFDSCKGGTIE